MLVDQLMTRDPKTCTPEDTLETAARLLWEHDVGVVPVISGAVTVGMLTDRDVCMAAYTQGRPLREIAVSSAMSRELHAVHPGDSIEEAMDVMRAQQVRRLAVVDDDCRLRGVLALNDLANASSDTGQPSAEGVVDVLAAVGQPRTAVSASEPALPACTGFAA